MNIWNSLSNTVVQVKSSQSLIRMSIAQVYKSRNRHTVDTVDKFKLRLDKFWMYQDIKYDFTAELTGTGDRSEYDIENYY